MKKISREEAKNIIAGLTHEEKIKLYTLLKTLRQNTERVTETKEGDK